MSKSAPSPKQSAPRLTEFTECSSAAGQLAALALCLRSLAANGAVRDAELLNRAQIAIAADLQAVVGASVNIDVRQARTIAHDVLRWLRRTKIEALNVDERMITVGWVEQALGLTTARRLQSTERSPV